MEENSQVKIKRLKQRIEDCMYVAGHSSGVKRQFIITKLFEPNKIVETCVDELSERDLDSICSDPEVISKFKKFIEGLDPYGAKDL